LITRLKKLDYNRELIELLLLDKIGIIAFYLLLPVVYCVVFRNAIPLEILFAWLFLQVLTFIVRLNITRDFLLVLFVEEDEKIKKLLKFQLITIFVNAFLWGIAASLTLVYAEENLVLMMLIVLFMMFTFSIAVLTPIYHAVFIFIFTIIITFMVSLVFITHSSIVNLSFVFLLLYLALFIPVTYKVYKTILTSIEQKEEILFFNFKLEQKLAALKRASKEQDMKIRDSLENFRTLLDSSTEMIIVTEGNGDIVDINYAGVKKLIAINKENLIGRRLTDFVQTQDREKLNALVNARKSQKDELSMKKTSGEVFIKSVSVYKLFQKEETLKMLVFKN